jgi:hypothetical protein
MAMDIEIGEVTSEVVSIDLKALRAEITADVLRRIDEDARLKTRHDADRRLRDRASDDPDRIT